MQPSGPNAEQIAYWNEQTGPKWVRLQQRLDEMIGPLGQAGLDRVKPVPGERALDVGCGCGASALEIAERVGAEGSVLGLDISSVMLERAEARAREQGLGQARFLAADAQTHPFQEPRFDLVFSRFGVMFFSDPDAAFRNLHAALAPGGRLGFVCWQAVARNPWMLVPLSAAAPLLELPPPPSPEAPGPFAFADPDRVRRILASAGFEDVALEPLESEISLGGEASLEEAVAFVLDIGPTAAVLRDQPEPREAVTAAVRGALAPFARPDGVRLPCSAWVVTARRH
ncbi:MAG: class I SAM-dependent methyltransferase [Myxococcota bacterium]